ncbi:MAG: SDR family NAD(P)-dependent oxidoreductase [Chloroflexales bacterium]|nr:SDR family NAD(P)-dependent oxidoreductase [Chloroflexales bacterium]
MRSFSDRVAVVTGAASGIGQVLSECLAQRGCHLALVDINEAGLAETARRITRLGRSVSQHCVDVANKEQMAILPGAVIHKHRHVHILVNNAGVSLAGPFETCPIRDLEWIVGVNLWGMFYGCAFFLPALRNADEGHIVNVSSDFGLFGLPTKTAYCLTKFAIRGFSEALRAELHNSRIGLTCVYPGAVDTGLIRNMRTWDTAKRDIETRFVANRGIPVTTVAERIVQGIERNTGRVLIGGDTYLIDAFTRLMPSITNKLVARFKDLLPFI